MRPLIAGLFLALIGGVLAPPAAAQSGATRAIVLTFEGGRRGDRAREAVIFDLASHVELVTEDQAIATAEAMSIDVSSPDGLAEVVRELGVELIVMGAVSGRGREMTTTLVVANPDGDELARGEAPGPTDRAALAEIGHVAIQTVDGAMAALRASAVDAAPEPEPEPEPVVAPEPEPEPEPEPARDANRWRHPLALIRAGLRARTVSTSADDESTNLQYFFEASMYPEIELEVRFRPLTDEPDELARGLILGASGAFSAGINYEDAAGVEQGLTSWRLRVEAGYGYTIEDMVEIQGIVGFGVDGVELGMPDGFVSTLFSYLRPAAVIRVDLYRHYFVIRGEVGARIGLDGGQLAAAFGPGLAYGGVDLAAGFSGVVEPGFTWTAMFGYSFMALGFEGDGGTIADAGPGRDETIELRILAGWAL